MTGLMMAAIPLAAAAQNIRPLEYIGPQKGDWELTLGGSGNNNNDFDAGQFGINGSIGYFFTDFLEFSVRQGVNYYDVPGDNGWSGSTRGALDLHLNLKRFQPFVGGNIGGIYGKGVHDTGAAGLEAGLKYYVKPKTFLFAMGEYQWLFDKPELVDNNFGGGQFVYSLGVGFNF